MENLKSLLPFIIPIITHKNYKCGNRTLWVIVAVVGMQFIGPILYFIFGKEDW